MSNGLIAGHDWFLYAAFIKFRVIYYEIKDFLVGQIVMQKLHLILMGTIIITTGPTIEHFF